MPENTSLLKPSLLELLIAAAVLRLFIMDLRSKGFAGHAPAAVDYTAVQQQILMDGPAVQQHNLVASLITLSSFLCYEQYIHI